ncbi:SDR family oxidoreductase [Oleiagrimonas sp. C23AA]|uniref:SDR family NAD(P)-dependent oxidoreductase n=1 Tax=Oleiagrimonas sp. C23AA TaxID=2719047 RepID=UPI00141F3A37|nr:SDR family oxidoreductase [Oleiagrimonas sp. C23AA]NII10276.1 SDR family oxidoreductase [Oleiagrimonas sp. C23AA]
MQIDLSGKRALVTASTGGIGLAIAIGLARAGAHVTLNGRSEDSVQRGLEAVREHVPDAGLDGIAADLSDAAGARAIMKACAEVDILVNNAGIYGPKPFFEVDDELWESYLQTNVMSGVRLSRAYLQGMMARGWGRIVFISSESALNIPPDMLHYGVTKTAQLSLARGLAKLARHSGVTVNSVLPGPTASDGFVAMLKEQAEKEGKSIEQAGIDFVRSARPSSIIGRPASVEEVANMVVYACSEQASATSGAALRVDGGVVDTIA